jgi:hypothetical protein
MQNWKTIEPKVEALANTDFTRSITTNAGALIAAAFEPSDGNPLSPVAVLRNISAFIQGMIDYDYKSNPQLPTQLTLEKAKVDLALQQLEGNDAETCPADPLPVSPQECQTQRLIKLFGIFGLENGSQVFSTDLQNLVSTDLQNRFNSNEFPDDKAEILKAAGMDLFIRLQEAGLGDLDPISTDLNNARGDYETSIRTFREFFAKAVDQAILHELILTAGESATAGPNRPHGQKLAQLCMFWLTTANIPGSKYKSAENWPSAKAQAACEGAEYYNANDGLTPSGTFKPAFNIAELEKALDGMPFDRRVCVFHSYKTRNRANTLYTRNGMPAAR